MDRTILEKELQFRTSRSGGAGGQNVNKVSTKVEVLFDVQASLALNAEEKARILQKLVPRINNAGQLQVVSQSERTQMGNKRAAVNRLFELLETSLHQQKARKKTTISRSEKERRLVAKKRRSELKRSRSIDF